MNGETELTAARREIDAIDREIAALFERRMAAAEAAGRWKTAHGLPLRDESREAEQLERAEAWIADPSLRPYYRELLETLTALSRRRQAEQREAER